MSVNHQKPIKPETQTDVTPDQQHPLIALINAHEDWLMRRVLSYAKARAYTKYTSTLEEAWRLSISGISSALTAALQCQENDMELGPDEDFASEPVAAFGIEEARRHRRRGIDLAMFLGLMKYYRQSYVDLVQAHQVASTDKLRWLRQIERFFDRVEIGFCTEWSSASEVDQIKELQATNRRMTNEKNKYLTMAESLNNPVILLDYQECIAYCNQAAAELGHGDHLRQAEYYRSDGSSSMARPALAAAFPWLSPDIRAFRQSRTAEHTFEKTVQTSTGEKTWRIRLNRMRDVSEKFKGLLIALEDMTEIRLTEQALRRQNAYMAALHETSLGMLKRLELVDLLQAIVTRAAELTQIPDGFLLLYDPASNMLEIKAACGQLVNAIGYRIKPGQGFAGRIWQKRQPLLLPDYQSWPKRMPNALFDSLHAVVGIPLTSGTDCIGVIGLAHHEKDQQIELDILTTLEQFARLAAIAIDNATLYHKVHRELRQRKALEKERKRMEKRLRQAQKMEALGTLAGGIAHDFNNLLLGILGNVSLVLAHTEETNPDYDRLRNIEQHVQSASELTRQLLGFARGGKYEVKPIDLNRLIHESAAMFGRTRKEITIHLQLDAKVGTVEADKSQIEQVLLNLFVNAWHAMSSGGHLFLKSTNTQLQPSFAKVNRIRPGQFVQVTVTDTGVGMDEAIQRRIFEPFFTTKEKKRGTGLGLASAYGIIKNHGGMITVDSTKGHGTTFNFYLPTSGKRPVAEPSQQKSELPGQETVLLVDDEAMIIEVGSQMLRSLGYQIITAQEGQKAIEIYKRQHEAIDVVILDMIMPGINGEQLYKQFRTVNPSVKVLLSSGYSLEGQAASLLNKGCNAFIQKPYSIKELSQKLRDVLACGLATG